MITHELQPNLTLFEPPDNEHTSFSVPGSPHLQGFGEKSGASSLPDSPAFNSARLNVSQNEVSALDSATLGAPVMADWETQAAH